MRLSCEIRSELTARGARVSIEPWPPPPPPCSEWCKLGEVFAQLRRHRRRRCRRHHGPWQSTGELAMRRGKATGTSQSRGGSSNSSSSGKEPWQWRTLLIARRRTRPAKLASRQLSSRPVCESSPERQAVAVPGEGKHNGAPMH